MRRSVMNVSAVSAVKFRSGEDRVCSWTDVSFEAIVICFQLTLVLVGDVSPHIVDISFLLSDPDN